MDRILHKFAILLKATYFQLEDYRFQDHTDEMHFAMHALIAMAED